jgi:hypothetical protein
MKANANFFVISCLVLLSVENVAGVVENIATHVLCSATYLFRKSCRLLLCGKYCTAGQLCMLDICYKYTLRICNSL